MKTSPTTKPSKGIAKKAFWTGACSVFSPFAATRPYKSPYRELDQYRQANQPSQGQDMDRLKEDGQKLFRQ